MGQPKNVDKGVAGIKLAIGIQKESGGNVNILARMGIFPNRIYPFRTILGTGLYGPELCIQGAFSFIP